jgi:2-hydroxychromene-2-carboxylate isomerase
MSDRRVQFFYSVGSRYSYLASTQIAALERDTGAEVEWIPVSSVAVMAAHGYTPFDGSRPSGQYDFRFRRADAEAWAEYYGVPYREPHDPLGLPGECALGACAALRLGALVPFSHAFFRAHFVDGATIRGNADLAAIAARIGLDEERFNRLLADPQTEALHASHLERARQAGVFGVPSFVVNGRMFWGNDRLVLVRHALTRRAAAPG